jgi:hypothetical protein
MLSLAKHKIDLGNSLSRCHYSRSSGSLSKRETRERRETREKKLSSSPSNREKREVREKLHCPRFLTINQNIVLYLFHILRIEVFSHPDCIKNDGMLKPIVFVDEPVPEASGGSQFFCKL